MTQFTFPAPQQENPPVSTAKKRSSTPRPRKTPLVKKNVKATANVKPAAVEATDVAAGRDFAPNQPPLTGMEDVDERVPELEELCKKVLADREKRGSLADSIADDLESVGKLLGENNLDCYIVSGRKFYISPAESHVKITKVKQS